VKEIDFNNEGKKGRKGSRRADELDDLRKDNLSSPKKDNAAMSRKGNK